jgi:hypothetical protein
MVNNDARTILYTGFPTYHALAGIYADLLEPEASRMSLKGNILKSQRTRQ